MFNNKDMRKTVALTVIADMRYAIENLERLVAQGVVTEDYVEESIYEMKAIICSFSVEDLV